MAGKLRKLDFLDALRGWAILLVLLVHSGGLAELFGQKLALTNIGQRGVQLFYEVSAFSLLYSWYSRKESTWKAFFVRRFFRIAPLFYLSIAGYYVYSVLYLKQPALSFAAYASGFLFLFGFHPSTINAVAPAGWSVAVESTFYVLFPFLALGIRNLETALAFTAVSVLACFGVCYGLHLYPITALPTEYVHFLWFPVEFPIFCFGFVAFFFWRDLLLGDFTDAELRPAIQRPLVRGAVSLCLLLLGIWALCSSFPVTNYRLYLNSLSFVFLILSLAVQPWVLFVNPITRFIGRLSFSIYLVHPYLTSLISRVLDAAEQHHPFRVYGHAASLLITFAGYLGGSLLIALVTFPLVEKRGIKFGNQLIERLWPRGFPNESQSREKPNISMKDQDSVTALRAKINRCYTLWAVSLVATFVTLFVYSKLNPDSEIKSVAQYRSEIDQDRAQLDEVSASLLQNQRALKSTEQALDQANDVIRHLQSQPHG